MERDTIVKSNANKLAKSLDVMLTLHAYVMAFAHDNNNNNNNNHRHHHQRQGSIGDWRNHITANDVKTECKKKAERSKKSEKQRTSLYILRRSEWPGANRRTHTHKYGSNHSNNNNY